MRVRVKICGLTSREAVRAAVEAGADALGFVFADSPRSIDPERAAELGRHVPRAVARVAVFQHPSPQRVSGVLGRFDPEWVQSDHEDRPLFRDSGRRFLPVFRDLPGTPDDLKRYLAERSASRPRVLFEGAVSGRGVTVDRDRARDLARKTRLVLAGGLTPENVGEAIREVRPYAVDVSSGVESSPGVKDPRRISDFIRAVRRTERELAGPVGELS